MPRMRRWEDLMHTFLRVQHQEGLLLWHYTVSDSFLHCWRRGRKTRRMKSQLSHALASLPLTITGRTNHMVSPDCKGAGKCRRTHHMFSGHHYLCQRKDPCGLCFYILITLQCQAECSIYGKQYMLIILNLLSGLAWPILLSFWILPTLRGNLTFWNPGLWLENLPLYIRNKCFKIKLKTKIWTGWELVLTTRYCHS